MFAMSSARKAVQLPAFGFELNIGKAPEDDFRAVRHASADPGTVSRSRYRVEIEVVAPQLPAHHNDEGDAMQKDDFYVNRGEDALKKRMNIGG
nr:hypothetical protein CFP56_74892 [Quercus suber]